MRLVTFSTNGQSERLGILSGTRVYDASAIPSLPADMLSFLALGEPAIDAARNSLEQIQRSALQGHALEQVKLSAPIPRPGKILCMAGNYTTHTSAGQWPAVDGARSLPQCFLKPSTSVLAPGGIIQLPWFSEQVDWELELAVVIGKTSKRVPPERVMEYVAGYTIFLDISARSFTFEKRPGDEEFWFLGKYMDTFGPMGPCLVLKDEIENPHNLRMTLKVNGDIKQDGNTSQMILKIPEIVSAISQLLTLEPGDLISTGTCGGVGYSTGTFLKPGDLITGEIELLGTISTSVKLDPSTLRTASDRP
jgi:2-keto-4-pentenoate hydratase/2-oxohepta-3-ene-1,7-dioic acid hydratase in catechol pathway